MSRPFEHEELSRVRVQACIRFPEWADLVRSRYFVHLIDIESGSAQGEYTRLQIERALELLGTTTLRELLQFFCKSETRFQCIHEDEAYFNIMLRFACGVDAVGVLFEYADPSCNFAGSFSVFDMLAWIQEDVSRLST